MIRVARGGIERRVKSTRFVMVKDAIRRNDR